MTVERQADTAEVAYRLLERPGPNDWAVLLTTASENSRVAAEVAREIDRIGGGSTLLIHVAERATVLEAVRKPDPDLLVLWGFEELSDGEWQALDRDRSRLYREGNVALVITAPVLGKLASFAPNLASWLGGSVWTFDESQRLLSPQERERRLEVLRSWAGLTDQQVIERATNRTLPADPHFAEWLVLLGRGELIER